MMPRTNIVKSYQSTTNRDSADTFIFYFVLSVKYEVKYYIMEDLNEQFSTANLLEFYRAVVLERISLGIYDSIQYFIRGF